MVEDSTYYTRVLRLTAFILIEIFLTDFNFKDYYILQGLAICAFCV